MEVTRTGRFTYASQPDNPTAVLLAQVTDMADDFIADCIRDRRGADLREAGFTRVAELVGL